MSLKSKLTQIAKPEKRKELIDKAQAFANDPRTREKIAEARGKVEAQVGAAKHKLAEKRGEKDRAPASTTEASADPAGDAAVDAAAATTTTPPPPAYGDDDGPKAA